MLRQLVHRGPDGNGIVELPDSVLGQTRLAIIDPSYRRQPMGRNGSWIAFSGEIYNYRDLLATELGAMALHSQTDTEVLLELFRRDGPACIEKLDGMFAIALMHGNDLFLARDYLGIQPLYIGWQNNALFFASELKTLQQTCTTISEFPAGTWYDTKLGWHQYFQPASLTKQFTGSEREARNGFSQLLAAVVQQQGLADAPIGLRLGNGVEDGIIAGLALRNSPRLMTFASGMSGAGNLELAQQQAAKLGSDHHENTYTGPEIIAALPWIVYHLEAIDPFMVRQAVAAYFLAKFASTRVKVLMMGEGAPIVFGGQEYLSHIHDPELLQEELLNQTGLMHKRSLQWTDRMNLAFSLEVRLPFLSRRAFDYGLRLPAAWKIQGARVPNAFLQATFPDLVAAENIDYHLIAASSAEKIATVLVEHAATTISNEFFLAERDRMQQDWHYRLEDKETLLYFGLLRQSLQESSIFASTSTSA